MINKSIPRLIKKIKNPSLKLLSNIFSFIYRQKLIVGFLFLLFLAHREYDRNVVIIRPIEVPAYLEINGLTSKAIANKINDKLNYIRQEADQSLKAIQFSTESDDSLPEIVVPGTGIPIIAFSKYIVSEFFSGYKHKECNGCNIYRE